MNAVQGEYVVRYCCHVRLSANHESGGTATFASSKIQMSCRLASSHHEKLKIHLQHDFSCLSFTVQEARCFLKDNRASASSRGLFETRKRASLLVPMQTRPIRHYNLALATV